MGIEYGDELPRKTSTFLVHLEQQPVRRDKSHLHATKEGREGQRNNDSYDKTWLHVANE